MYFVKLIEDCIGDVKEATELKTDIQKNFSAPFQKFIENKQKEFFKTHKEKNQLKTSETEEQEMINSLMLNSNFSDYFNLETEEDFMLVTTEIQSEINTIAGCSFQLWYTFSEFLKNNRNSICEKMEIEYKDKI